MAIPKSHIHPELVCGANPLLEPLPPFVTFSEWPEKLYHRPLDKVSWRGLPVEHREALLNSISLHYVPIRTALEPAADIQNLLRRSIFLRNPLTSGERRRTNLVALQKNVPAMLQMSSLDGAGGIVCGMTGTGKSSLVVRALKAIAPDQVIRHGHSDACGWERLDHVVWLYVDYPSNGSRGGLLQRILMALDEALGTDYCKPFTRQPSIDVLLASVCRQLSNHRVALLVIDEKQQRNFDDSPWKIEFVLFYLSLMNLGISVLLIGNPLAFDNMRLYSQVMRRFSMGGIHEMKAAESAQTPWWCDDFLPRMRRFSLVEKCDIPTEERDLVEFGYCHGLQGLYPALLSASLTNVLRRGGPTAELKMADIHAGARSSTFSEARKIADALGSKPGDSSPFLDIPAPPGNEEAVDDIDRAIGKAGPLSDASIGETAKNLVKRYKTDQTNLANKALKGLETLMNLTSEDRRMLGVTDDLLQQARKMQEQGKKISPTKKRGRK